ncbi:MAG: DUF4115 domain-containing protein [Candidatus Zixiibacteriota bacterium]|nr:MAG: DUF4115 domain-containing protein [candidate division Zixibacteria bacterium]
MERKRKGVTLEDLSDQLKISQANLEHIEKGEVGELPSMIYYDLFAKAYAESLGIDFDRTMEAIKEDVGEAIEGRPNAVKSGADKKTEKRREETEKETERDGDNARLIKKLLYLFGAIVVVFVLFLIGYSILMPSEGRDEEPGDTAGESSEAVAEQPVTAADSQTEAAFDWNVPGYQEPEIIRLRLIPQSESWSTVLADGDTAIFRNLLPGRIYEVEAQYRLTVSVGIPSQVRVELNGREVNLADAETGRISRVEINQVNLEQFLSPERAVEPTDEPEEAVERTAPPVDTNEAVPSVEESQDEP